MQIMACLSTILPMLSLLGLSSGGMHRTMTRLFNCTESCLHFNLHPIPIRGDAQDIDEAIQLYREALALHPFLHPNHAKSLNDLASTVCILFEQQGNAQDLDEAIQLYREVLTLYPSPHPHCGISLNNLATAVGSRFEQQGDAKDIEEAIQLHREAVALRPTPHPDRRISLNNLVTAVQARFNQCGDVQDVNEAIQLLQEVFALCPSPHPDQKSFLNNLAIAVQTWFEQRGNAQDLNEAIQLYREALSLLPTPHPGRVMSLNNLGTAVKGDTQDIDEAIRLHHRGISLYNLATAIQNQFEQQGDVKDIDEAIELNRETLTLWPSPHPHRGGSLNNLANTCQTRFEQQGDAQDIDQVVELDQEVLSLCPPPHPKRGDALTHLANALVHSYKCGRNPNHLNDAIALFQEASFYLSSSPLTRFKVTHMWVTTATKHHHPSALSGYLCAVGLSQYSMAVEFLEASRSVFWSQALHIRTLLNILEISHPQLASQLSALASELEQPSFRNTLRNLSTDTQHEAITIELEGDRCQCLNADWQQSISSVQKLPGFEDFMQPKGIMALKQAAVHGPIVILNAGYFDAWGRIPGETSQRTTVWINI
ncbi:hypothetical protein DFH07DRAFT_784527 [Mycena maculata]|uniref:TPR-like protein n=1 Tax=Mycena maculata TaxID=230809 RepID=A0AAD7HG37_9AGAR|nr:hypothetical protein DFH07DRAFT_784527 [Mycena maculata]